MDTILPLNTSGFNQINGKNQYTGKSITETLINGFITVDQQWKVIFWNQAAEKLLGVQASEIVGLNLWDRFAAILPADFYRVYENAFLTDAPVHFVEYWPEMGSWFDVVCYHCGDTLSISFKSMNQLKQPQYADQQLQILTELYRYITEVTNDCLWEWNLSTEELFWIDGGHERVFGYPIVNTILPQKFWESLIHVDDSARVITYLKNVKKANTATSWDISYRLRNKKGEYASVHDRGHLIYVDNKITRIIGATQDISELVLLEEKLSNERKKKQIEITSAMLTAQENERAEIGKELHDNLNQILAVAKMYIQMAKSNKADRDLFLDKSYNLIVEVIEEIRKISKHLVVPGVRVFSLSENIRNLVEDLCLVSKIEITYLEEGIENVIFNDQIKMTIFRIVQEQLTNVVKHAKAKHASVELALINGSIQLLITDDGIGCDLKHLDSGVGLINIRSRAEVHKGKVSIHSAPNEGFLIRVLFPASSFEMKAESTLQSELKVGIL